MGSGHTLIGKTLDTQWLSPRQVLLLAPAQSEFRQLAAQALRLPQYVLAVVEDHEDALRTLGENKVEVLLFEPEAGKTRSPGALAALRAADADVEIVVLARRLNLVVTMAALQVGAESAIDFLGGPSSAPELTRSVERARELRYLRRSEERRQRAEARMTAVVQGVPLAVISFDDQGTIHDWNPGACTIFDRSAVQAIGQSFWSIFLPEAQAELQRSLPAGTDAASSRRALTGLRRDGRVFPAVLSLAPIPVPGRAMFCAIVEDVTEGRRLEIELRQAQKLEAVGRLASGLAHEINTPCQFIGANEQFLAGAFCDLDGLIGKYQSVVAGQPVAADVLAGLAQAEQEADLVFVRAQVPLAFKGIAGGVKRITAIVAAMKDFAQADQRNPGPIDINQAVTTTLAVVQHQLAAVADTEISLGAVPTIHGYAGELNQALLNVLLNAIQAVEDRKAETGTRGRITVATTVDDKQVVVAIGDTGKGIPEAIRSRVFDPFFTTREVGRGVGQGLTVARSIVVDKHQGRLEFDSQEGVGARFFIRLPLTPAAAPVGG